MLRNHLLIAWRNLAKYKFYSSINIVGLAIGLAAFLFILLYVQDEISYDQHHPYAERTFRIDGQGKIGDQVIQTGNSGAPVGPTMKTDFPEVETFCRLRDRGSQFIKYENRHYNEESVIFADSTFFQVFAVELQQGDPATALSSPNSIVMTRAMAEKYFGIDDPMGKSIVRNNQDEFKVTGIINEMPSNGHFKYDFLLSLSSIEESRAPEWGNMNFITYVVLQKGLDVAAFEKKVNRHLIDKYFGPEVEKYIGMPWTEFIKGGNAFDYSIFPITDIHLYSAKDDELSANSDIKYVWIFSIIGLFILLIACINFMNLSTARSAIRAKEIGVRKVIGAMRKDLIGQFLGESMMVSFLALCLAWCIVFLALPYFNELSGKTFSFDQIITPAFILITVGLAVVTGLLAGSYPAAFLSRFQPVKVLKGVFKLDNSSPHFRNALVVFQFLITVFLICGTLIVYQQLNFIQNKKLGYDREHLVMLHDLYPLGEKTKTFKEKILALPEVTDASLTSFTPVSSSMNNSSYFIGDTPDMNRAVLINNSYVDHDFIKTMSMEIVQGRNFLKERTTDDRAVLINERLATYFDGDPIGQVISNYGENPDDIDKFEVIGIIKDFNFESLRQNIEPLALFLGEPRGFLTMRLHTENIPEFINTLQSNWNEMAPAQPFTYNFMDERFDRIYRTEQRIGNIIGTFAFLAILIACIGLIGLSTFMAQQRTKEIGIRKVLGASTAGLVSMLSRDFLKLVGLALILAVPVSWWALNKWLQSFAYRIDIGWSVFALAGTIAIAIAFLTVSFQSIRAAVANPVGSLRSE
ncbi:MAG: ABC transporter permease [Bacteroidota bacterium]